ncbi:MAG: hypothetical protein WKF55_08240 [Gemmatimonadaceae bacterium]
METRFDKPLDLNEWEDADDLNGRAIGTRVRRSVLKPRMVEECGDSCGGGGGSTQTPGYYMTFSRIVDRYEPWTKGDPEIELHFHGPTDAGNSQYGADLSCSGEYALPEKTFNQDNAFWNGSVLLFNQSEADAFAAQFPDGHHVIAWEDDDTACLIKSDKESLSEILITAAGAVGGAALKTGGIPGGLPFAVGIFLATIFQDANWLLSNDDILGVYVPASARGDSWSDANYTLERNGQINGRAMIVKR